MVSLNGYDYWENTLKSGRGFSKHECSEAHKEATERLITTPKTCTDIGEFVDTNMTFGTRANLVEKDVTVDKKNFAADRGRKSKNWEDLGDRSRRSKVAKLAEHPAEALALASIKKATRDPTEKDFVVLMKSATNSEKNNITEINFSIKIKTEDALSLKVQCDLSDEQYQIIRNPSIIHNADIYPSLHEIKSERHKCYPEGLIVTETSASTPLQGMFNHTLTRILTFTECQDSMRMFAEVGGKFKGVLHFQGGFDVASSQSVYKQKYTDTNIGEAQVNKQSLFQTAIVPLKF
nr:uncharacterized protein LOC124809317 [Hydra vulgaris]